MRFSEELADWTDWYVAEFLLGRALGIFPESAQFQDVEEVVLLPSPVGNALRGALQHLTGAGILENHDESDQYRWSPRRTR
ncbi:hypothetical protein [Nocardia altamirensis]|uniref:hypothetical protein n=1 Tax=Nocardia altamirensis TaxID=472158 RepID=UPI0008401CBD|nr:hypothetical protein [Nocardia altamirensis]